MINSDHAEENNLKIVAIGSAIAISLQILITIYVGATPIRIGFSDCIAPLGILSLWRSRESYKLLRSRWIVPNIDCYLLSFLAYMAGSCLYAWIHTNTFITWAWGPKLMGFFILLMYFYLGGAIALYGDKIVNKVVDAFLGATWVISAIALIRFFVEINGFKPLENIAFRPVGFSENPNAFALMLGTSILIQLYRQQNLSGKFNGLATVGMSGMIATLFLTGSRSAYLGLIFAVPSLIIYRRKIDWKKLVLGLLVAIILVLLSSHDFGVLRGYGVSGPIVNTLAYATRNSVTLDGGVQDRIHSGIMAIKSWSASPLWGTGVGAFLHNYSEDNNGTKLVIHNSALWLLSEMGLIGFISFTGILAITMIKLRDKAKMKHEFMAAASLSVLFFSIGSSVGTEVIYQRQIWFLVGLAVTSYPIDSSKKSLNTLLPQQDLLQP